MSVNSIYSSGSASAVDQARLDRAAQFQQCRKDFRALGAALQSGDITAAQSAFATLQKDMPQRPDGASKSGTDPMAQLGQALSSGDLSAAQSAFTQVQQAHKGHHGHHGHGKAEPAQPDPSTQATPLPDSSSFQVSA